jgi:hypothetical protein
MNIKIKGIKIFEYRYPPNGMGGWIRRKIFIQFCMRMRRLAVAISFEKKTATSHNLTIQGSLVAVYDILSPTNVGYRSNSWLSARKSKHPVRRPHHVFS